MKLIKDNEKKLLNICEVSSIEKENQTNHKNPTNTKKHKTRSSLPTPQLLTSFYTHS